MRRRVWLFAAALVLALGLPAPAWAQDACRAACGALPRDDRPRLLACLQRCGVAVQQPTQGRLVAGTGYGRRAAAPALVATAAATPAAPQGWGAIYTAPAPLPGLGVVAGARDRLAAHGGAESACAAGSRGLPCRALVEFTSGCAAAARAAQGDRVTFTAAELGLTRDAAERAALGACQSRAPGGCRVVRTVCLG